MGVSIMLTIIPRPPPGSGLFLQGKAWAGKPWDSRTGTKSHLLASLPFTAIAISLVPPTLCSFPSLFSPSLVFSFCILFSIFPSPLIHCIGHDWWPRALVSDTQNYHGCWVLEEEGSCLLGLWYLDALSYFTYGGTLSGSGSQSLSAEVAKYRDIYPWSPDCFSYALNSPLIS